MAWAHPENLYKNTTKSQPTVWTIEILRTPRGESSLPHTALTLFHEQGPNIFDHLKIVVPKMCCPLKFFVQTFLTPKHFCFINFSTTHQICVLFLKFSPDQKLIFHFCYAFSIILGQYKFACTNSEKFLEKSKYIGRED